nr:MAG TPA: FeoB-associated Cys-rich membrane protein [Caudoviricetes sp.]
MSEETGLIILLGLAVVSFAIRQIVKYRSDKKGKE